MALAMSKDEVERMYKMVTSRKVTRFRLSVWEWENVAFMIDDGCFDEYPVHEKSMACFVHVFRVSIYTAGVSGCGF